MPVFIGVPVFNCVSEEDVARNITIDKADVEARLAVFRWCDAFGLRLTMPPDDLSFLSRRSEPSCCVPAQDATCRLGRTTTHRRGLSMGSCGKGGQVLRKTGANLPG